MTAVTAAAAANPKKLGKEITKNDGKRYGKFDWDAPQQLKTIPMVF